MSAGNPNLQTRIPRALMDKVQAAAEWAGVEIPDWHRHAVAAEVDRCAFTVTGDGAFPFAILAAGQAWPMTISDADSMGGTKSRSVTLAALKAPTRSAWRAAGWSVRGVRPPVVESTATEKTG